tara:strand:- start:6646 stop:6876 length:231 start_codon:yes stop_codon:yes gene_type:complete
MKVGDIVKLKSDGLKDSKLKSEIEQSDCGIVIGFKQRGYQLHPDPNCDIGNDAIVLWPDFGVGYNMRAMLEVIISV